MHMGLADLAVVEEVAVHRHHRVADLASADRAHTRHELGRKPASELRLG